ncbi:MAG: prolyl oligopeptidase family serine peptidase [Verrucomicrobiota bacterium]
MRTVIGITILAGLLAGISAMASDDLEQGFRKPPGRTKPQMGGLLVGSTARAPGADGDANPSPAAASLEAGILRAQIPGKVPTPAEDKLALTISRQYGADRRDFSLGKNRAFVILPTKPSADGNNPWVWYAPTFPGSYPGEDHAWMFTQLLERGFAIAGINVGESYGSPDGRVAYSQLYDHLVQKYGLARKACLLPQSRGGLMLYNWAAENPEKVQCIGGIYTVGDLRSYPGLHAACAAYHMSEAELQARLADHNPIERLAPLAKAQVPILHLHGDHDTLVPLEKNSGELVKRYQALGGPGELIVIPGKGHQVCDEFFKCQRLVDFFLSQGHPVIRANN